MFCTQSSMSSDVIINEDDLPSLDEIPKQSVTSVLADEQWNIRSPQQAAEQIFYKPLRHLRSRINYELLERQVTDGELNLAEKFGRFSSRPSDLFLKLFHNVLCTLKRDPLSGRVSPSLIGTTGVLPLTIISTIPDIMQHYYHCIVHAETEVLLATNFWEKSESVTIIGQALRMLSKRAENDNRTVDRSSNERKSRSLSQYSSC